MRFRILLCSNLHRAWCSGPEQVHQGHVWNLEVNLFDPGKLDHFGFKQVSDRAFFYLHSFHSSWDTLYLDGIFC